jgi:hypothetical protein
MTFHPVPMDARDRAAARRSWAEAVGVDVVQDRLMGPDWRRLNGRPARALAAGRNRRRG